MVKIDEYFSRNNHESWSILDFLNKCDLEPFGSKIDLYLRSLQAIVNSEQGSRQESAQVLLNRYRKARKDSFYLFESPLGNHRAGSLSFKANYSPS